MSLFPSNITQAAQAAPVVIPTPAALPVPGLSTTMFDLSSAISYPGVLSVPGMARPYLAHQVAAHIAARYSIDTNGCVVIGDDMGMGKTQVLLGLIAERIADGGYAIVIAPPVTKAGYVNDMKAAFPALRFAHLSGRKPDFANLPIADVYWLSDDSQTMQAWLTRNETYTDRDGHEKTRLVANAFAMGAKHPRSRRDPP